MKTDDLIEALVEDRASADARPQVALFLAVIGGALVAAVIFMLTLGYRHDIAQAAESYRFLFKFVVTLTLVATAVPLVLKTFRPEADLSRSLWLIVLAPLMLVLAALAELMVMPASSWLPRLIGTNARFCLSMIPILSVGPLLAFFAALKTGAPADPGLAGALAGLSSGAIAATFYAGHCTDDSPLFVIVWYSIAIGFVTLVGYLAGRRWLVW